MTIDGTPPTSIDIMSPDTPVPYDPAKGLTMTVNSSTPGDMNGVRLYFGGTPANGDTFTIGRNTGATGDGGNALSLANQLNSKTFSRSITLSSAYGNYVNGIGNTTDRLKSSADAQNPARAGVAAVHAGRPPGHRARTRNRD